MMRPLNKTVFGLTKVHSCYFNKVRYYAEKPSSVMSAKEGPSALNLTKKPSRGPFMKNIFLGEFDLEALVYPELDKEGLQELKKRTAPYKDYFKSNVDPKSISKLKIIPNELSQGIRNLSLFGQLIPAQYGGLELTATETANISECLAKDLDVALTLYSHNFHAVKSLLMYGTQQQKDRYLPRLASGEWIAAYASSEKGGGSDLLTSTTELYPSETDSNQLLLNGKKIWIVNGKIANLFVVTALCQFTTHAGDVLPAIRLVIVEKDTPGVTIVNSDESLGLNSSNICDVHFNEVPVGSDCLLGDDVMQGLSMATDILNSERYNIGAITVSLLKDMTKTVSEFIANRKQFEKPLRDCEIIHTKFADVATTIYALESMTYQTTLTLDSYEDPDCSLELAIIKIFSFTEGKRCLEILVDLMGAKSFSESETVSKYFRDFRTLEVFDGTTDLAKMYVSMMGLQHAGVTMQENISKLRNPFNYPGAVFKRMIKLRGQIADNPKLTLKLFEQLHPSLTFSANALEYCVLRFNYAVSNLLMRHGADAINQQTDLIRLADAATKIYAMTCALGRASRAYCIGLRNAETELRYAIELCDRYKEVVKRDLNDVVNGELIDMPFLKAGPDVINRHGYFLEHPLERSF